MTELLLDTHLWLWSSYAPEKLSPLARHLISEATGSLYFSTISLIEIAIKQSIGKLSFAADVQELQQTLLVQGVKELTLTSQHVFTLAHLPLIHRDPFDRLLVAQAITNGLLLLTADRLLTRYSPTIRFVG